MPRLLSRVPIEQFRVGHTRTHTVTDEGGGCVANPPSGTRRRPFGFCHWHARAMLLRALPAFALGGSSAVTFPPPSP